MSNSLRGALVGGGRDSFWHVIFAWAKAAVALTVTANKGMVDHDALVGG